MLLFCAQIHGFLETCQQESSQSPDNWATLWNPFIPQKTCWSYWRVFMMPFSACSPIKSVVYVSMNGESVYYYCYLFHMFLFRLKTHNLGISLLSKKRFKLTVSRIIKHSMSHLLYLAYLTILISFLFQ